MDSVQLTPIKIQQALNAGIYLLSDPDLKVRLKDVSSLEVLKALLLNIQDDRIALVNSPRQENEEKGDADVESSEPRG